MLDSVLGINRHHIDVLFFTRPILDNVAFNSELELILGSCNLTSVSSLGFCSLGSIGGKRETHTVNLGSYFLEPRGHAEENAGHKCL